MVRRALAGLKGVRRAEVSFYRGEAIVTYEDGAVTIEQMKEALARDGFRATLKTSDSR